jgi:hypothetical protein
MGDQEACRGSERSMLCDSHARIGGYYFRQRHGAIHRHTETVSINADHTAHWQLKVDLELPTDKTAKCLQLSDECVFLFPLAFLKKSDPRTGFKVEDRDGQLIPVPIREECDRVSSIAAAQAGVRLLEDGKQPKLDLAELERNLYEIPAGTPFESSQKLSALLGLLEPTNPEFTPYPKLTAEQLRIGKEMGEIWSEGGLTEILRMFVEHSMIWVPLRGIPGERRSITVSQDIALVRRPVLRWSFGTPTPNPRLPWTRRRFKRWEESPASSPVLDTGEKLYGRRAYRISFPALGQRVGEPLAWMPVEYDFPTIYTKRCSTYHFELICPRGLSPRNLKVGRGDPVEERLQAGAATPDEGAHESIDAHEGRTTLMPQIAHHYRRGNRTATDLWFRVTVGLASGAFPVLWFLAGAITAILLWALAGTNPNLSEQTNGIEIVAGILLVVPAMMAALAIGGEDTSATKLIGGARILLLVTGLNALIATAVLIDLKPFHIGHEWMWTACAMAATTVTVPLATSWILSSPNIWRQMQKLKSADAQYRTLLIGILLAEIGVWVLMVLGEAKPGVATTEHIPIIRLTIGVYLLSLAIGMTALANNRTALDIGKNRRYAAVCLFAAAFVCLALASIEIKTAISAPSRLQSWLEASAFCALLLTWYAGRALSLSTHGFRQANDEIHVSPNVGRALIAKERVRELIILQGHKSFQPDSQDATTPSNGIA